MYLCIVIVHRYNCLTFPKRVTVLCTCMSLRSVIRFLNSLNLLVHRVTTPNKQYIIRRLETLTSAPLLTIHIGISTNKYLLSVVRNRLLFAHHSRCAFHQNALGDPLLRQVHACTQDKQNLLFQPYYDIFLLLTGIPHSGIPHIKVIPHSCRLQKKKKIATSIYKKKIIIKKISGSPGLSGGTFLSFFVMATSR